MQSRKTSGKSVWELYESGQFDAIKERTASEIEDAIEIASSIASGIVSGKFWARLSLSLMPSHVPDFSENEKPSMNKIQENRLAGSYVYLLRRKD